MSVVTQDKQGDVLLVTVNNPPVNALSAAVRAGLMDAIEKAGADETVKAVVIACAGRTFIAGADISEFGKPPQPPHLPDLCQAIEDCEKPVVAALHGTALGGGLEVALGCHWRVADQHARAGLPEVHLGLLPGAGGTQRLPRLIGAQAALRMITEGKPVDMGLARELGLVDEVTGGDVVDAALAFARAKAGTDVTDRRLSTRNATNPGETFFQEARQTLAKKRRGFEAPQACVDAVEAAVSLPFADGMATERKLFEKLRASSQSRAQRHLFFAERESAKIDDIPKETKARPLDRIAVIGAGTMGGGIAMALADSGLSVLLKEVNQDALDAGLGRIRKLYEQQATKGRITQAEMEARMGRITATLDYDALQDADLVIEAAFEKMAVKQEIFTELDRVCKKGAVLATNTSYLDVNAIADGTSRPADVLGLHFFSPANIMKLLEIVRGHKTAPDVLKTATTLARRIGKIGVVAGVCHGFIGNRMFEGYQREAGLLLVEGAQPEQVDKALTDYGMAMGPLAVADLAGLDIGYFMRQSRDESEIEPRAFRVHDRLVEMGRKGQKTGAGLYNYPEGARRGEPDPEVARLIEQTSADLGIERRRISDAEIVDRCILALVNEGLDILSEGIAQRASDIDVVYANGYGFPRWRGGPLFDAAERGFDTILDRVTTFQDSVIGGERWWQPSPLLEKAAKDPGTVR
ncbi:3-hydroxyacyl-CoA dehydrogenase NAD-binding domain-containing protein [Yunchengibacter salinarum]|uniref:3-hydroxyacyl-CoA dehydrogenase NAD-binding domain-containing protein n=1 Tax=Yunchengibacter salinarum TaxID=3133399 RepID=UPI0035B6815A